MTGRNMHQLRRLEAGAEMLMAETAPNRRRRLRPFAFYVRLQFSIIIIILSSKETFAARIMRRAALSRLLLRSSPVKRPVRRKLGEELNRTGARYRGLVFQLQARRPVRRPLMRSSASMKIKMCSGDALALSLELGVAE